jgi:hypothetical protein
MRERLMMVSVSDFVNYVDHSANETKLGPAVLETLPPTRNRPHAMANSRTQLTRLIFAWEAAFNQPVQDVVHRRDEAADVVRSSARDAFEEAYVARLKERAAAAMGSPSTGYGRQRTLRYRRSEPARRPMQVPGHQQQQMDLPADDSMFGANDPEEEEEKHALILAPPPYDKAFVFARIQRTSKAPLRHL